MKNPRDRYKQTPQVKKELTAAPRLLVVNNQGSLSKAIQNVTTG